LDPLTHTLTGAALADAGLRERTPLATATLVIGANLPDVDAFTYFVSPDVALYWRRGWSHGVVAWIVLPLLLAGAVLLYDRWWRRRRRPDAAPARPGPLLLLAGLGVATHPFLDWLNTYGIRLLMPFDDRWYYGDILFIVEPWLWLILGGATFLNHSATWRSRAAWGVLAVLTSLAVLGSAPSTAVRVLWLAGLAAVVAVRVAAGRGAESRRRSGVLASRGAVAATVLYVAALGAADAVAAGDVRDQLGARGITVEELMVGPLPANPLRRDVVAVTPDGYRLGVYDWLEQPRFRLLDRTLPRLEPSPPVTAALGAACVRGMVVWMRFPTAEVEERPDGGYDVHLLDVRYARRRDGGFGSDSVRVTESLEPRCGGTGDESR